MKQQRAVVIVVVVVLVSASYAMWLLLGAKRPAYNAATVDREPDRVFPVAAGVSEGETDNTSRVRRDTIKEAARIRGRVVLASGAAPGFPVYVYGLAPLSTYTEFDDGWWRKGGGLRVVTASDGSFEFPYPVGATLEMVAGTRGWTTAESVLASSSVKDHAVELRLWRVFGSAIRVTDSEGDSPRRAAGLHREEVAVASSVKSRTLSTGSVEAAIAGVQLWEQSLGVADDWRRKVMTYLVTDHELEKLVVQSLYRVPGYEQVVATIELHPVSERLASWVVVLPRVTSGFGGLRLRLDSRMSQSEGMTFPSMAPAELEMTSETVESTPIRFKLRSLHQQEVHVTDIPSDVYRCRLISRFGWAADLDPVLLRVEDGRDVLARCDLRNLCSLEVILSNKDGEAASGAGASFQVEHQSGLRRSVVFPDAPYLIQGLKADRYKVILSGFRRTIVEHESKEVAVGVDGPRTLLRMALPETKAK